MSATPKFTKGQLVKVMDTMFSRKIDLANRTGVIKKVMLYDVYLIELDNGWEYTLEEDELCAN